MAILNGLNSEFIRLLSFWTMIFTSHIDCWNKEKRHELIVQMPLVRKRQQYCAPMKKQTSLGTIHGILHAISLNSVKKVLTAGRQG